MSLCLGLLSWHSHETLLNTLKSWEKTGFLKSNAQRVAFFQEITAQDRIIADMYGFECIGSDQNVGIGKALVALLNASWCDNFIFLENDWVCVADIPGDITRRIGMSSLFLREGKADLVRLRSRTKPGDPLYSEMYLQGHELDQPRHLLDCVHWMDRPDLAFPNHFTSVVEVGERWFSVPSRYGSWTNNPFMASKEMLMKYVVPIAETGHIHLEPSMSPYWEEQGLTVMMGEGLFTHQRIDR